MQKQYIWSGTLGPDVNVGAAGSANASVCSACPAGSYSNASGNEAPIILLHPVMHPMMR
jgi:hypothetical protein